MLTPGLIVVGFLMLRVQLAKNPKKSMIYEPKNKSDTAGQTDHTN